MIDSGIAEGHPLLAPAIGDTISFPSSLGSGIDAHGHGTKVAGIALYREVGDCIRNNRFAPQLWLLGAKVTETVHDEFGRPQMKFPDEKLIPNQMREAIEYFHGAHGCRVFNISLGDDRLIYDGNKPSIWAWVLDELARRLDVVIVVSAGNFSPTPTNGRWHEVATRYPRFILESGNRIIEPATAAIPLTVGSLANSEVPRGAGGTEDVALRAVAPMNAPSPFTRCGPGVNDAIKPELCEFGGNLSFDHRTGVLQGNNPGLEILTFHQGYTSGRLFAWDKGTSFASPKVAHYCALILSDNPRASANLVRALLASSASIPQEATGILEPLGANACTRICGYGKPDANLARRSSDNRIVLYAENRLPGDRFHVYEIPVPDIFRTTTGKRSISVSLAFDPPTRHTRKNYLGFNMKFWLVRGKTSSEVVSIFRKNIPREDSVNGISGTRFECALEPGHNVREKGTLQKGTFSMNRNPNERYGGNYHLVIQCARNWSQEEAQRYAVVVVMEHLGLRTSLFETVSLYAAVQQLIDERIRGTERIRIRP